MDQDNGADSAVKDDLDDLVDGSDNNEEDTKLYTRDTRTNSVYSSVRSTSTSTFSEVAEGLRTKANTPANLSIFTSELKNFTDLKGQDTLSSGDEVFQRAMTLLSDRCTSSPGEREALFSYKEPPFGVHIPHYFYVQQSQPQPMPPLKVWRGYKGNVYFEPISIRSLSAKMDSSKLPVGHTCGHFSASCNQAPTRATTAGQSTKSYRLSTSSSRVFVMDRDAVFNASNKNFERDLNCIEEMESTGSLALRPCSSKNSFQVSRAGNDTKRRGLYEREKICRGSTVIQHVRLNRSSSAKTDSESTNKMANRSKKPFRQRPEFPSSAGSNKKLKASSTSAPNLIISGDKLSPRVVMSPLLRTTTHFSFSGQRAAVNTPDLIGAYEKYPYPVCIGLQHLHLNDNLSGLTSYTKSLRYAEELKPFIKYIPDRRTNHENSSLK